MNFLRKVIFLILIFLNINLISNENENIIKEIFINAENLSNKLYSYILSEKEELKVYVEEMFSKIREDLSSQESQFEKIKIFTKMINEIFLLIDKNDLNFKLPKFLLKLPVSNDIKDYDKYIKNSLNEFETIIKCLLIEKEKNLEFSENIQNLSNSAQILISILQETISNLSLYIKNNNNDYLKSLLGEEYLNYNTEKTKFKIAIFESEIQRQVSNLQDTVIYLDSFDFGEESNVESNRKEYLNKAFNVILEAYSFSENIFNNNFDYNFSFKNLNKNKKRIFNNLKKIFDNKKKIKKNKKNIYNLTNVLYLEIQNFAKNNKNYLVSLPKKIYQTIYNKIYNFTNLNSTGKLFNNIFTFKKTVFALVLISVYKYLKNTKVISYENFMKNFYEKFSIYSYVKNKEKDNRFIDEKNLNDDNIKKKKEQELNLIKEEKYKEILSEDEAKNIIIEIASFCSSPLRSQKKLDDLIKKLNLNETLQLLDNFANDLDLEINERSKKSELIKEKVIVSYIKNLHNSSNEKISDVYKKDFLNNKDLLNDYNFIDRFFIKTGSVILNSISLTSTLISSNLNGANYLSIDSSANNFIGILKSNIDNLCNFVKAVPADSGNLSNEADFKRYMNTNFRREDDVPKQTIDFLAKLKSNMSSYHEIYGDFQKKTELPDTFVAGLFSVVGTYGSLWAVAKGEESLNVGKQVSDGFKVFHDFMMNKEKSESDFSSKKEVHSKYTLDNKVFDTLRNKGELIWFYSIINGIKNPFVSSGDISRVALISGPSGSGKTFLTKAFAQTIANVNGKVRFIAIDPKDLFLTEDEKKQGKPDMIQQIIMMLDQNANSDETFIVHFDEFHLFFSNENGGLNHSRIADFLKLFNELNVKQKKTVTGFYIIISTNKPNLVPVEFFQNPTRVGAIIYIDYPDMEERKTLIKSYLNNIGIPLVNIDIDHISDVLEGKNISQGILIKIIQVAIAKSRILKKVLDTNIIFSCIDQISKGIIFDDKYFNKEIVENLSNYHAISVLSCIGLDEKSTIKFDSATIYPIVEKIKPDHIDSMYKAAKERSMLYGKCFFNYRNSKLDFVSSRRLIEELLIMISGETYCKMKDIGISKKTYDDNFNSAFESALNFIEFFDDEARLNKLNSNLKDNENLTDLELEKLKSNKRREYLKEVNINNNDSNVVKKVNILISECKSKLINMYNNSDNFKSIFLEVVNILKDKKIIRYNDIKSNKIISEKIENYKKELNSIIDEIKNLKSLKSI